MLYSFGLYVFTGLRCSASNIITFLLVILYSVILVIHVLMYTHLLLLVLLYIPKSARPSRLVPGTWLREANRVQTFYR
jgi:hypothetical protein